MINFFNFSTENDLFALFLGSGLHFIFYWEVQSLIFIESLFKLFAEELMFWTTEKREVLFPNNFVFEIKLSDKSLIQIRKNNGPSIGPWGTTAST